MILLLGGTTEAPQVANLLAENNCMVLISNLTESLVDWDMSSGKIEVWSPGMEFTFKFLYENSLFSSTSI